jgi:hypothetical protein
MGQSNSVPGSENVPFEFWDVINTSNAVLDQAFSKAETGDYVIRRILGDPTLFELLVLDAGARLRYTFRHDQNQYHYGGQIFSNVDNLLASLMHSGMVLCQFPHVDERAMMAVSLQDCAANLA